jgi:SAM-dependent methyltransferase
MSSDMQRFWDERAREDAAYFVDNEREYGDSDLEAFWARGREALDELLGQLGLEVDGGVVLEIGCGLGRMTRVLAERAHDVIALDVSREMLQRAADLNDLHSVSWMHGDGVSLHGIGDASVDAVVSHVVFQHLPDPAITQGYVREMGRVLKPAGWAAFQVSNDPEVHRPRRRLRLRLRGPRGQRHRAWLGSAVALDDLRAAAVDGGLAVERVVGEGTQFCLVALRRV